MQSTIASHELKTPVTALNATLENMILGIGKFFIKIYINCFACFCICYRIGKNIGNSFFKQMLWHELKTPVTALNATLENMILGIGKYKDYDIYLPECKEMTEYLADMIHDILETSRLSISSEKETAVQTNLSEVVSALCEPYMLIAKAKGIVFRLEFSERLYHNLPIWNQYEMCVKFKSSLIKKAPRLLESFFSVIGYFKLIINLIPCGCFMGINEYEISIA